MKKNFVKIICTLVVLIAMIIPTSVLAKQIQPTTFTKQSKENYNPQVKHTVFTPLAVTDFDPLDEKIIVTVAIKEIRALKTINTHSNPNFYKKSPRIPLVLTSG
jgi:uncharacterized protein with FMN-binding domain